MLVGASNFDDINNSTRLWLLRRPNGCYEVLSMSCVKSGGETHKMTVYSSFRGAVTRPLSIGGGGNGFGLGIVENTLAGELAIRIPSGFDLYQDPSTSMGMIVGSEDARAGGEDPPACVEARNLLAYEAKDDLEDKHDASSNFRLR